MSFTSHMCWLVFGWFSRSARSLPRSIIGSKNSVWLGRFGTFNTRIVITLWLWQWWLWDLGTWCRILTWSGFFLSFLCCSPAACTGTCWAKLGRFSSNSTRFTSQKRRNFTLSITSCKRSRFRTSFSLRSGNTWSTTGTRSKTTTQSKKKT